LNYPVYCEQPVFDGLFEPLNTLTNLAFVIAGIMVFLKLRKGKMLDFKGKWFSLLLVIIGFGSLAWHLARYDVTLIIDSLPIGIFILSYLYFYLRVTVHSFWLRILFLAGLPLFILLFAWVLKPFVDSLLLSNGGMGYLAALAYFAILQMYNFILRNGFAWKSLYVVFLFFISICFRQYDLYFCEATGGMGTHFIWHILNAVVLYRFSLLLYL